MAKIGGSPPDAIGLIVMGMSWLGLVLLGPGIPAIDWIEYVLGSVGVFAGVYMAATE